MNLEDALRELGEALATDDGSHGRDALLRDGRLVLIRHCLAALGVRPDNVSSFATVIRMAADAPVGPARRFCAVLVVHALAVRGLVPGSAAGDVCVLAEKALRDVLVRCGYPFGGSMREKWDVLERLHRTIGELMQPLEPTFPGWLQGMHAG